MITVLEWAAVTVFILFVIIAAIAILCILSSEYSNAPKEISDKIKHCDSTLDNIIDSAQKLDDKQEMTQQEIESIAFRPIEYK